MGSILVFGSNGFIGKNLTASLQDHYPVSEISLRNDDWRTKLGKSEVYINLIGKAHDHKGTAVESDYFHANYELTKELFESFQQSDAKLFIHISSIAAVEEYESTNLLDENAECNPVSFYGKSKRKAETYLLEQNLNLDKKIVILRPTMVHGPGDKGNLTLLFKLISKGIPYPLAKFDNKRSFLSIGNFNFCILKIIENRETIHSGIYNVCDDEPVATSQIIEIIKRICNQKVLNLYIPKKIIRMIAITGNYIPIPLNSKRLNKMTASLIVSNKKIGKELGIQKLPVTAAEGLETTLKSFLK